jgi:hypothetical protein
MDLDQTEANRRVLEGIHIRLDQIVVPKPVAARWERIRAAIQPEPVPNACADVLAYRLLQAQSYRNKAQVEGSQAWVSVYNSLVEHLSQQLDIVNDPQRQNDVFMGYTTRFLSSLARVLSLSTTPESIDRLQRFVQRWQQDPNFLCTRPYILHVIGNTTRQTDHYVKAWIDLLTASNVANPSFPFFHTDFVTGMYQSFSQIVPIDRYTADISVSMRRSFGLNTTVWLREDALADLTVKDKKELNLYMKHALTIPPVLIWQHTPDSWEQLQKDEYLVAFLVSDPLRVPGMTAEQHLNDLKFCVAPNHVLTDAAQKLFITLAKKSDIGKYLRRTALVIQAVQDLCHSLGELAPVMWTDRLLYYACHHLAKRIKIAVNLKSFASFQDPDDNLYRELRRYLFGPNDPESAPPCSAQGDWRAYQILVRLLETLLPQSAMKRLGISSVQCNSAGAIFSYIDILSQFLKHRKMGLDRVPHETIRALRKFTSYCSEVQDVPLDPESVMSALRFLRPLFVMLGVKYALSDSVDEMLDEVYEAVEKKLRRVPPVPRPTFTEYHAQVQGQGDQGFDQGPAGYQFDAPPPFNPSYASGFSRSSMGSDFSGSSSGSLAAMPKIPGTNAAFSGNGFSAPTPSLSQPISQPINQPTPNTNAVASMLSNLGPVIPMGASTSGTLGAQETPGKTADQLEAEAAAALSNLSMLAETLAEESADVDDVETEQAQTISDDIHPLAMALSSFF